jgi:adenylate cyclase
MAGVPLWWIGVFVQTLHSDALGRSFVWRSGADVVVDNADFDLLESDRFCQSPLAILYASGQ